MKIIFYEIRKNFFTMPLLILLGILLILNTVVVYVQYRQAGTGFSDDFTRHIATNGEWNYYQKLHQELDGNITKEKVHFVVNDYKTYRKRVQGGDYSTEYDPKTKTGYLFSDYSVLNTYFYEPMKYLISYRSENDSLVKQAKQNIVFFKQKGNSFEVERNTYIVEKYQDRAAMEFYDTQGWRKLLEYDYSDFMVIVMLFACMIPCFYSERKNGMENIILSTKKGRRSYVYGKYLAFYACAIFLVLIFAVCNYMLMDCLYNLPGGGMKLYSLQEYRYTSLDISVRQFYVLVVLFKCIALCGIVTILGIISRLFSNVFTIFMVMLAMVVIGLYCSGFVHGISNGAVMAALASPFSLLQGAELYKGLSGINAAGHFVPWLSAHLAVQVLLQIGLWLLQWIYTKCISRRRRNAW